MALIYYSNVKKSTSAKIFLRILAIILFSVFFQKPLSADIKHENLEEYRSKGLAAQQQGLLKEALIYYQKALFLDEQRVDIYNDLGIVSERLGNVYAAKNYYFKAIDLDKNYLPSYLNLAYLYKRQGDSARAIEYFKRRVEFGKPGDPWTKEAVGELRILSATSPELKNWLQKYEMEFLAREVKSLSKKLNQAEKEVSLSILLESEKYVREAQAYEKEEMYAEALAQYDRALSIAPKDPQILEYRRLVLLKLKEEKTERFVSEALETFSTSSTDSPKQDSRQAVVVTPDE